MLSILSDFLCVLSQNVQTIPVQDVVPNVSKKSRTNLGSFKTLPSASDSFETIDAGVPFRSEQGVSRPEHTGFETQLGHQLPPVFVRHMGHWNAPGLGEVGRWQCDTAPNAVEEKLARLRLAFNQAR